MSDYKSTPSLPSVISDLAQRVAALERVITSSVETFPVAITAASAPNNSIFRDSADNVIKIKDNAGTVRLLY